MPDSRDETPSEERSAPSSWREVSSVIGPVDDAQPAEGEREVEAPPGAPPPSKKLSAEEMDEFIINARGKRRLDVPGAEREPAELRSPSHGPPEPAPTLPPASQPGGPPAAPEPAPAVAEPAPVVAEPAPAVAEPAPSPPSTPAPIYEPVGREVDSATVEAKAAPTGKQAAPTSVAGASDPMSTPGFHWQPGEVKLIIEQGLSVGKEFLVSDPEMLVGRRDPDQDFLPDIDLFDQETATNRYISRRQARLYFRDGRLFVEDLESSNGTAINNKLIAAHEPRQVNLNDKLLFGQSVLLRVKRA